MVGPFEVKARNNITSEKGAGLKKENSTPF